MEKIVEVAYKELNKLKKSTNPSWETYSRIADLSASLKYLLEQESLSDNDLSRLINDMRSSFGDEKTLDVLSLTLVEFKSDIDCVSPQLTNCLIKKIKENI